jgi:hypothetical protein
MNDHEQINDSALTSELRESLTRITAPQRPPLETITARGRAHQRHRLTGIAGLSAAGVAAGTALASVAAVALTIGSAPSARATLDTALTRTLAQSYHLTETAGSYDIGSGGRITYRRQIVCANQADPVRQLEATSCSVGFLHYREVGGYSYWYFTAIAGHPGKHWERFPVTSPDESGSGIFDAGDFGFVAATPQQMLSQIKKAGKVTVIGPVSGRGWTGTRYAFSWGFRQGPVSTQISGTVDVDRQGRARALALSDRRGNKMGVFVQTGVLTFSDFGAPVTVTPPPADQTCDVLSANRGVVVRCG